MLTSDVAAFVGFVCEALLYGVNVVLFFVAVLYLIWRRKTRDIDTLLLWATCVLFALCTTHFTLEFDNMLHVLILNPGVIPISQETHLLLGADILFSITDFVGNLVLTYRCWLIWGMAPWALYVPIVVALASVVCAMAGLGILATTAPTAPIAPPAIAKFGTASFAMSLILNFFLTALIIGRLYYLGRLAHFPTDLRSQLTTSPTLHTGGSRARTNRSGGSDGTTKTQRQVRQIIGIIIESGLLFFIAQFVFVVVYALGHPAQGIVVPAALQIYSISPLLIIVRVGMGLGSDQANNTTVQNQTTPSMQFAPQLTQEQSHGEASEMELSPLEGKGGEIA